MLTQLGMSNSPIASPRVQLLVQLACRGEPDEGGVRKSIRKIPMPVPRKTGPLVALILLSTVVAHAARRIRIPRISTTPDSPISRACWRKAAQRKWPGQRLHPGVSFRPPARHRANRRLSGLRFGKPLLGLGLLGFESARGPWTHDPAQSRYTARRRLGRAHP